MLLDEYWEKFLRDTGRDLDTVCSGDLSFDSIGFSNDSQIALVLGGRKTAFFSSLSSFLVDGEQIPCSGELYLVLDRANNPVCIIELQSVSVIPFCDVSFDMVRLCAEDENLEEWKNRQKEILEDEGSIIGYEFSPNIKLVFQTFSIVYKTN